MGVNIPKIPISFAKDERYIYDYIRSKRNYSVYIKDLVEEDIKRNKVKKANEEGKYLENNRDLGIDF